METRSNPHLNCCRVGLLVALAVSLFAGATKVFADVEDSETKRAPVAEAVAKPEVNFLKRELKYVPVSEALPRLANVIYAIYGFEPEAPAAKAGESPESLPIGEMLLVADPILNNLIVSGPKKHLDLADHFLTVIDVRPTQVRIDAILFQVELGDDIEHGMDILRAVEALDVAGEKIDLSEAFRTGGRGGAQVLALENFTREHFGAYGEALEAAAGTATIVGRPMIFTAQNQKAKIVVGSNLDLEILALINSEDEVTLEIATNVEKDRGEGKKAVSQLHTKVRLPNQSVIAFGGLIQDDNGKRSELLVLLHPEIIPGEE